MSDNNGHDSADELNTGNIDRQQSPSPQSEDNRDPHSQENQQTQSNNAKNNITPTTGNEQRLQQAPNHSNGAHSLTNGDRTLGNRNISTGPSSPSKQTPIDPKQSLEPFDWDGLEERFLEKMSECQKREEELGEEFKEWCQVSSSSVFLS